MSSCEEDPSDRISSHAVNTSKKKTANREKIAARWATGSSDNTRQPHPALALKNPAQVCFRHHPHLNKRGICLRFFNHGCRAEIEGAEHEKV